jgi:rod shape-determining protein MreC
VISILNSNSQINAQLKKTFHFGSLVWDGKDPNIVQLIDVPRQAPVQIGDTIVTGGRSLIFPQGLPIGKSIISLWIKMKAITH